MKVAVGISGASGAIYGIKLLEEFKRLNIETHLIISTWGAYTITEETGWTVDNVKKLAAFCYEEADMSACISSGSFLLDAMVIAPCSMKKLACIAAGYIDGLITRAADVCLKERRKLILLTRESPLSLIHIDNMHKAAAAGAVIMPPVPAFYIKPKTVNDLIDFTVVRIMDQLGILMESDKRWHG